MNDARRTYQIGKSQLTIDSGSVLDVPADVVVSSDDYRLTMSGGVSAAIRTAAGSALDLDAAKAIPRESGDVVVTTAGALPARYVFHVVTIGPRSWNESTADGDVAGVVRRATRVCLELMRPLGVHSIVFPSLGTGSASYPVIASAAAMAEVIHETLSQTAWPVYVSIMVMPHALPRHLAFYEEFARRVPQVATHRRRSPPASPGPPEPAIFSLLGLEQQRQKLEQELIELRQSGGDAARDAELRAALAANTDQRALTQARRHKPASVFVSYARQDDELRRKLSDHLGGLRNGGYIKEWNDAQIIPGSEWESEIREKLEEADIILLLITSSFLGSKFIGDVELVRALDRHRRKEAIVIPVILKPADWKSTGLKDLQALPEGAKPVSLWANSDEAYVSIAEGLRKVIDDWRAAGEH